MATSRFGVINHKNNTVEVYVNVQWSVSGTTLKIERIYFTSSSSAFWSTTGYRLTIRLEDRVIYDGPVSGGYTAGYNSNYPVYNFGSGIHYGQNDINNQSPTSPNFTGNCLPKSISGNFSGNIKVAFGSNPQSSLQNGGILPYKELGFMSGDNPYIQTASAPNLGNAVLTSSNPSVYVLKGGISGVDWGIGWSGTRTLSCRIQYRLDNTDVDYTLSWTDGASGKDFTVNGLTENPSKPWLKVPDDETVTMTWYAGTNVGSSTRQTTQYCQTSYTAYVIEQGKAPVEAELRVSNTTGSTPNKVIRRIGSVG